MSLRQDLAALMATRPPALHAMLADLAAMLRTTALERMVKPGSPMPAFVLPGANGEVVFSGDLVDRGLLVVVFFRGDWCPFCKVTLTALNEALPAIEAAGARLVALTFDTGEYAAGDWRDLALNFPVLTDLDGSTALEFGAIYRVPEALKAFYLGRGLDLTARHGDPNWYLPIPSTFIADREGIVRYVYASGDISDRMEPEEIVARVREVAAGTGSVP